MRHWLVWGSGYLMGTVIEKGFVLGGWPDSTVAPLIANAGLGAALMVAAALWTPKPT